MSSLLTLPRELRDEIVSHVFSSHAVPEGPLQDRTPRRTWSVCSLLKLPVLPVHQIYGAYGLSLTNHQLHAEADQRLQPWKATTPYVLDVMIVGDELWPTWICCPIRQYGPVDTVHVQFRSFHPNRKFMDIIGKVLCPNESYSPLTYLIKFITATCASVKDGGSSNDSCIIKNLIFNFSTPPDFPKNVKRVHDKSYLWEMIKLGFNYREMVIWGLHNQYLYAQSQDLDYNNFPLLLHLMVAERIAQRLEFSEAYVNERVLKTISSLGIYINGELQAESHHHELYRTEGRDFKCRRGPATVEKDTKMPDMLL